MYVFLSYFTHLGSLRKTLVNSSSSIILQNIIWNYYIGLSSGSWNEESDIQSDCCNVAIRSVFGSGLYRCPIMDAQIQTIAR